MGKSVRTIKKLAKKASAANRCFFYENNAEGHATATLFMKDVATKKADIVSSMSACFTISSS